MSLLQAAQKVDGSAAFAYNEEGYRWFQQDRLPDAEAAFGQAVDTDPASAPALNNLAITYFVRGDLSKAERYLNRAMEQNPDNPIARYNLGITLMQLNDPAGAIREFREAGFMDPGAASPLLQQAYLYNQVGDYTNAEQRARIALKLNPSLARAHLLLGIALYNQGRDVDALASFTETLSREPDSRVAAFYQALILGHMKQYDAALPILHGLLIGSPHVAETARILAEIDALYLFKLQSTTAGP
jgi:superkiller protein 3